MQSIKEIQQVPIHCKIVFGEDIRRVKLPEPSFLALTRIVRTILELPQNDEIVLKYQDDEQDLITISTDIELDTAISLLQPNVLLRLFVSVVPKISLKTRRECVRQKWAKKSNLRAQFEPRKIILAVPQDSTNEVVPMKVDFSVKNVGERAWPIGTALALINKCKKITVLEKIALSGSVDPGCSVPVSIVLKAPVLNFHKLKWRLELPEGERFGWFMIKTKAPGDQKEKRKFKNGCRQRFLWSGSGRMGCMKALLCGSGKVYPGRFGCLKARAFLLGQGHPIRMGCLKARSLVESPARMGCYKAPSCLLGPGYLREIYNGWGSKIAQLKEMGFAGPAVFRALKAAGGDVELALNALL